MPRPNVYGSASKYWSSRDVATESRELPYRPRITPSSPRFVHTRAHTHTHMAKQKKTRPTGKRNLFLPFLNGSFHLKYIHPSKVSKDFLTLFCWHPRDDSNWRAKMLRNYYFLNISTPFLFVLAIRSQCQIQHLSRRQCVSSWWLCLFITVYLLDSQTGRDG